MIAMETKRRLQHRTQSGGEVEIAARYWQTNLKTWCWHVQDSETKTTRRRGVIMAFSICTHSADG